MDVVIDEIQSHVNVVDENTLLSAETLQRIVRAVLAALAAEHRGQDALRADLDLRSVVEQQRAASGPRE